MLVNKVTQGKHGYVCTYMCACDCATACVRIVYVCIHVCVCVCVCVCARVQKVHVPCMQAWIHNNMLFSACMWIHRKACQYVFRSTCTIISKLVFYAQSTRMVISGRCTLMKHTCIQMNNLNRSTYQGSIHLIGVRIGVGCVDSQCHTVGKDGDQNQKLKSCELVKEINITNIPHHINLTTSMCVWSCMSNISFLVYQTNNTNKMHATNQKQTIWNNTDSAQSLLNALLPTEAAVHNTGTRGRNLKGLVGGWRGCLWLVLNDLKRGIVQQESHTHSSWLMQTEL